MPCRSDYMEQTSTEKLMQETAQFCIYVAGELGVNLPPQIAEQDTYYAHDKGQVQWLCAWLNNLKTNSPKRFERIVYNARSSTARRLADWWEQHEAADARRIAREQADARKAEVRSELLAKMTDEEKRLFGNRL